MGNRLIQTAPSGTTNYSYDANNRLTNAGGANYTYDANGNLQNTSAGQSFTWDVFNRMSAATGSGGTATYTYNGDGLKIRRIGPDGTTRYYHDGMWPIWEADGAGSMRSQLDRDMFGNLLSRKEPAGTRRYYHSDALGNTTALTDEGGAAAATILYDAWGNQRAATGEAVPNYRFTGAELDTASGLYHMGARFYDPTIGRWLSEDPSQDKPFNVATLNYYSYVAGNPLGYVDYDGEYWLPIIAGVFGAGFALGFYLGASNGRATLAGALAATSLGLLAGASAGALGQRLFAFFSRLPAASPAAAEGTRKTLDLANLAQSIARITGGDFARIDKGFRITIPQGNSSLVVRIMESGGGRTNYYRISIPGKGALNSLGQISDDLAATHFDLSEMSLFDILRIIALYLQNQAK